MTNSLRGPILSRYACTVAYSRVLVFSIGLY